MVTSVVETSIIGLVLPDSTAIKARKKPVVPSAEPDKSKCGSDWPRKGEEVVKG